MHIGNIFKFEERIFNSIGKQNDVIQMSDENYIKLREALNRFPMGFPETASKVEIKILKRLYSEQEAELAANTSPLRETAEQIANRTGLDKKMLEEKLESMSKKGLQLRIESVRLNAII